jgi:hypothetical protein
MQPSATTRGDSPPLTDLSPETRHMIEETAREEIEAFGASGCPEAIARLAEVGRRSAVGGDEVAVMTRLVSDAQDEIAERLRNQRAVLSMFGAMSRIHKLAVAG